MAEQLHEEKIARHLKHLSEALDSGTQFQVRKLLRNLSGSEIGDLLESLPITKRLAVWELNDPEMDGEVLVHNILLSLDPTNRAWGFKHDTYLPMMQPGDVMRGICLGVIEDSRHPNYPPGTYVGGMTGWQEYAILRVDEDGRLPDAGVFPRDPSIPLSTYLGLFGHIGMTAYYGLLHIGKPRAGETVVVSAAAGATGSLVGQIAKIKGCRVVGIAGAREKCEYAVKELGYDACVSHYDDDMADQLAAQPLDIGAFLADDHAGACGVHRHPALLVRALDDHAGHARLLALFLDELADLDVFQQKITVILRVGVPAAVPGAVHLQAHADRIDFLTH